MMTVNRARNSKTAGEEPTTRHVHKSEEEEEEEEEEEA
jgi:hypothetical protein